MTPTGNPNNSKSLHSATCPWSASFTSFPSMVSSPLSVRDINLEIWKYPSGHLYPKAAPFDESKNPQTSSRSPTPETSSKEASPSKSKSKTSASPLISTYKKSKSNTKSSSPTTNSESTKPKTSSSHKSKTSLTTSTTPSPKSLKTPSSITPIVLSLSTSWPLLSSLKKTNSPTGTPFCPTVKSAPLPAVQIPLQNNALNNKVRKPFSKHLVTLMSAILQRFSPHQRSRKKTQFQL